MTLLPYPWKCTHPRICMHVHVNKAIRISKPCIPCSFIVFKTHRISWKSTPRLDDLAPLSSDTAGSKRCPAMWCRPNSAGRCRVRDEDAWAAACRRVPAAWPWCDASSRQRSRVGDDLYTAPICTVSYRKRISIYRFRALFMGKLDLIYRKLGNFEIDQDLN